ncbi:MAG TPA: chemotaxis protein CheW [Aggregatilineaceae bacterium]|nr:chemotaxis protein CheW [Aggregatilineaceae bacterium]
MTDAHGLFYLDTLLATIQERLAIVDSVSYSRPLSASTASVEMVRLVVFELSGVRYALDIRFVREVGRRTGLTHVPGLPQWVLGVMNLHGEIISVVDLAKFLSLDPSPASMLIIAQTGAQRIGLMVHAVEQIQRVPVEQIISPPFKVDTQLVNYLRGAVEQNGQWIRLLDAEHLLLNPHMQQFS